MSPSLMILNGPNLNFLGIREPHIYGSTTSLPSRTAAKLRRVYRRAPYVSPSNHKGELVDLTQSARESAGAIVPLLVPGADNPAGR